MSLLIRPDLIDPALEDRLDYAFELERSVARFFTLIVPFEIEPQGALYPDADFERAAVLEGIVRTYIEGRLVPDLLAEVRPVLKRSGGGTLGSPAADRVATAVADAGVELARMEMPQHAMRIIGLAYVLAGDVSRDVRAGLWRVVSLGRMLEGRTPAAGEALYQAAQLGPVNLASDCLEAALAQAIGEYAIRDDFLRDVERRMAALGWRGDIQRVTGIVRHLARSRV